MVEMIIQPVVVIKEMMECDIKEGFWPSFYLKENKTIAVSINNPFS